MIDSIVASSSLITIGDIKQMIKDIPDDYIVCLGDDKKYTAIFVQIETNDDTKECYLHGE